MSTRAGSSGRNHHLVTFTEGHAPIEAPACLGKKRYENEGRARSTGNEVYSCPWCGGWHTSRHGHKGKGRIGRRR